MITVIIRAAPPWETPGYTGYRSIYSYSFHWGELTIEGDATYDTKGRASLYRTGRWRWKRLDAYRDSFWYKDREGNWECGGGGLDLNSFAIYSEDRFSMYLWGFFREKTAYGIYGKGTIVRGNYEGPNRSIE